ncbi:hypothetical protein L249_6918, partial [Ophiocordyceps polyrhachis-furcata BCC 54312]
HYEALRFYRGKLLSEARSVKRIRRQKDPTIIVLRGLACQTLYYSLFLGPREQSTIAIKLKVPRVTYILAKLAYPQGYADSKEDGEALQIRGCFAGSEGIANLAVAYKDYINPCVSPRLAKDMPNPFIDDSLQPGENNN